MAYYITTTLLFVVIWVFAFMMAKTSDFTLFEAFVIFAISMLLSAKVQEVVRK